MTFFTRVYALVRQIPEGFVATYGDLAKALGTRDARRVGHALHANPDDTHTPCHRVVAHDGRLAPHYAFGGSQEQHARLAAEGVTFLDPEHVDLARHRYRFLSKLKIHMVPRA
jgi:methylated-DNA-protein-cysteine methyltransferase-like protein